MVQGVASAPLSPDSSLVFLGGVHQHRPTKDDDLRSRWKYELWSELLIFPLVTHMILPYIISFNEFGV